MTQAKSSIRRRVMSPVAAKSQAAVTSTHGEQQIGDAVRRLRDSKGLSVRTLAAKCGFSASFISQVELNKASPSLASLERIASGLGVTVGQFFVTFDRPTPALIRSMQRPTLQSAWSRAQIESLSPTSVGDTFEVLMVTLQPGGCSGTGLHSRDTKLCVTIFSGNVYLQFEESAQVLHRGDTISIPARTLYRWENKTGKAVQLLKVIAR